MGTFGPAYMATRDKDRITAQMGSIYHFMAPGEWWTLAQIAGALGYPEASVSAQLRHLRKRRFGGHEVRKRHLGRGLWSYRLIMQPAQQEMDLTK